jgi:hypothetical protein
MLFALSQRCGVHFKSQCASIGQENLMSLKSRPLRSVEGLVHRGERPQSLPPDTDS